MGARGVVVVDLAGTVCSPHESGTETVFTAVLLAAAARLGGFDRGTAKETGHLAALGKLESIFKPGSVAENDLLRRRSVDAIVCALGVEREALARSELDGVGGEVGDKGGATVGRVARGRKTAGGERVECLLD